MLFTNVRYFGADQRFHTGNVTVENGIITAVEEKNGQAEKLLLPGLIDVHLHGNRGMDFSDGGSFQYEEMARFLAKNGTTGFSATTMTLPPAFIEKACRCAAGFAKAETEGAARLLGITMEGPFFSAAKKGAQNADYLLPPDARLLSSLQEAAEGLLRIVCVAPELPGALDFIRTATDAGFRVSLAHTAADYDTAAAAFDAGACHLTHTFNAMPPLLHRAPGVIGAAAEREHVTAELIGDGMHVHPSAMRAAFKLFPGRVCLVSDAIPPAGAENGTYSLGEQPVIVKDGRATLLDGTLAGSTATLFACLQNCIRFGIKAEEAVAAATSTPAKALGVQDRFGAVAPGFAADLLLCSPDFELLTVFLGGEALS
ncbi:MAG: N-acetylglucosamine-6-phosphate deacetylase [Clostridiales bacterium]|nr:N-acetylglucosamine-6-phosphate deacetylase [Clostridiales bacterium]